MRVSTRTVTDGEETLDGRHPVVAEREELLVLFWHEVLWTADPETGTT